MQINKHNIAHKQNLGQKSHDHLNRCIKRPWLNAISLHDKNLNQNRNRSNLKSIYDKLIANIVLNGEKTKEAI
jgi:hypothetical protein